MKYQRHFFLLLLTVVLFMPLFSFAVHTPATRNLVVCTGEGGAPNCSFNDLVNTANNVIDEVLFLAVSLAAILFVWAGFLYITSGGDPAKVSKAHDIFKNVAIGFMIALGAFLIVKAILLGLNANLPGEFEFLE